MDRIRTKYQYSYVNRTWKQKENLFYSWQHFGHVLLITTKWKYYIPYLRLDMCYPMGKDKAGSSHGGTANWASLNSKISSNIHFFSLHKKYEINSSPVVFDILVNCNKYILTVNRCYIPNEKTNEKTWANWASLNSKISSNIHFFLAQEIWN